MGIFNARILFGRDVFWCLLNYFDTNSNLVLCILPIFCKVLPGCLRGLKDDLITCSVHTANGPYVEVLIPKCDLINDLFLIEMYIFWFKSLFEFKSNQELNMPLYIKIFNIISRAHQTCWHSLTRKFRFASIYQRKMQLIFRIWLLFTPSILGKKSLHKPHPALGIREESAIGPPPMHLKSLPEEIECARPNLSGWAKVAIPPIPSFYHRRGPEMHL